MPATFHKRLDPSTEQMPILQNIPVTLTAKEVIASGGRKSNRPELVRQAEEAIALGQTLWQPTVIYDWFDVEAVYGEQIHLQAPTKIRESDLTSGQTPSALLTIGPKADLLAHAQRVLVSVVTIGPALERRVQELQAAGDMLQAYLLDSAGVAALGAVGEAIRCEAEETAAGLGWGVSPSLSPGSLVGWSVRGQRDLCALLPLEEIGVRLNRHCVLEPHKSASGLIGLGPGYETAQVGSACKYCALQETCWRRRKDPS
jgi:hypothetical protein